MKIETPQEVEVWYLIPAIRRGLTLEMLKLGIRKKDIAEILNLTKAAVSQYLKSKRASKIVFNDKIKKEIKQSASKLAKKESEIHSEIQRLLHFIEDGEFICNICRVHTGVKKNCRVCY